MGSQSRKKVRKNVMKGMSIKSGDKRPTSKGAGLTSSAVRKINRKTGGNLQTAVTESKPRTKARAARRKSYCSRSKGQMKMHNINCSKTPKKRICAARRRWKC